MKNNFDRFLLSLLLGLSTLLGLSFWLNTKFGFNLFYTEHWKKLAQLQASQTPINPFFYLSIIIAILVFIIGTYIILSPKNKYKTPQTPQKDNETLPKEPVIKQEPKEEKNIPIPNITMERPPRLNLPTNMAQIVAQQQQQQTEIKPASQNKPEQNPLTPTIAKIFSDNGYAVKPNVKISEFTPNLIAIGPNEVFWIGGIDTDITDIKRAVEKLQSVFTETLEDITINVTPFILDTLNKQQQTNSVLMFKTIDELNEFITKNPTEQLSDAEQENFDSYSEYIDTVLQYIKNI